MEKIKRFLYENRRAKDDEPVWSIKFDELKEAVEFKGCQAIRSNAESNPFVALKLYRQRQIIEQGFNQLKMKSAVHDSKRRKPRIEENCLFIRLLRLCV